jgi:precorrin-6B methylase 2
MYQDKLYALIGKNPEHYDRLSRLFGHERMVRRSIRVLQDCSNGSVRRILEAGCGTGLVTVELLRSFQDATVLSFDNEPAMVEATTGKLTKARLHNRAHVLLADATGALKELGDERFDAVVAGGVFECTGLGPLKGLMCFLRDDGYFLNLALNNLSVWGRLIQIMYQCRLFSAAQIQQAFGAQGMELVGTHEPPRFLPASFKKGFIFQKEPDAH